MIKYLNHLYIKYQEDAIFSFNSDEESLEPIGNVIQMQASSTIYMSIRVNF